MNPAVSFCVHSLRLKARTAAEATQSRHGTDPSFFQFPAMGIAQLFHKPPPQLLPGLHGRTQQRPVKGAAQSVWSLSGTAGGNGFQQILPAQGRADGLGVVAPGRRAEGGQSFFFYIHALTVGSASFRVKTPFPAVHPGAGRRFLPTSRAGGAHFPASLRLVSRRAANSSKGTVPSRQKLTQFFLIHMVGRKTAAIIRKNPGLTGTNPQVQNLHPFLGTAPPASSAAQPEKRRTIFPYPSAAPLRSPETSSTGIPVPPRKLYGCAR